MAICLKTQLHFFASIPLPLQVSQAPELHSHWPHQHQQQVVILCINVRYMCNMTLNTACMLVLFFSKQLMAKTLFPSYTDYSICRKCCSPLDVTHNLRSPEVTVPSWRTSQDTLMSLAARSVVHCIQCPSPQRITAAQSSLLCMSTHNSGYRHIATVLQCILPLYPSIHSSS